MKQFLAPPREARRASYQQRSGTSRTMESMLIAREQGLEQPARAEDDDEEEEEPQMPFWMAIVL